MRTRFRRAAPLAVLAFVIAAWSAPALTRQVAPTDRFVVSDAMIAMRDGVLLHTKIFVPKDQRDALPIVMKTSTIRTTTSSGSARR